MSGRRQVAIAFGVMTLVFAGLLYRAEHRTDQTNERITKTTSPCLLYGPNSKLCQRSFETAVLTITHPEACAILRKAGLAIDSCRHARLRQELRRRKRAQVQVLPDESGGAVAPSQGAEALHPSSGNGSDETGIGGGGQSPPHQHPVGKAPPAPPTNPGSSDESGPATPPPSSEVASEGAGTNSSPENLRQPEEAPVKSTLEQTGEAVHTIGCSLTERLLHPSSC